jgi:hypothetical protein
MAWGPEVKAVKTPCVAIRFGATPEGVGQGSSFQLASICLVQS